MYKVSKSTWFKSECGNEAAWLLCFSVSSMSLLTSNYSNTHLHQELQQITLSNSSYYCQCVCVCNGVIYEVCVFTC